MTPKNHFLSFGPALLFCLLLPALSRAADSTNVWLEPWLLYAGSEFSVLEHEYDEILAPLQHRLQEVNLELQSPVTRNAEQGFHLLWERIQLQDEINRIEEEHDLKKIKLRYRKGIEIVKMLYEKILSMDHHFSSLKAQQEMLKISNPHNYPEFKETRNLIEDKVKKKAGINFPPLLQNNPFLSAAFSIAGLMLGGNNADDKDKKANLEKIACIMDFTVRMHNDMNVVYYETGYLRDANLTLKRDCEVLFTECARQVGYTIPLESCRNGDDWERLYALLDMMIAKALGENNTGQPNSNPGGMGGGYGTPPVQTGDPKLALRAETNLQFSIDRILQFINRYSDFVYQGNEYYKKFAKITSNYENEKPCAEVLPDQFKQLRSDIEQTLDKFNSAYRMPEVQGSKLKDMLYGMPDN